MPPSTCSPRSPRPPTASCAESPLTSSTRCSPRTRTDLTARPWSCGFGQPRGCRFLHSAAESVLRRAGFVRALDAVSGKRVARGTEGDGSSGYLQLAATASSTEDWRPDKHDVPRRAGVLGLIAPGRSHGTSPCGRPAHRPRRRLRRTAPPGLARAPLDVLLELRVSRGKVERWAHGALTYSLGVRPSGSPAWHQPDGRVHLAGRFLVDTGDAVTRTAIVAWGQLTGAGVDSVRRISCEAAQDARSLSPSAVGVPAAEVQTLSWRAV